jgi:uncharacterized membrane protein YphA (DoxX/SURF4 family)
MNSAALIVRTVLCVVFATAGAAKLANLKGSRDTLEAFGVPAGSAAALGTVLPVAELLTASALLPTASARWGAVAAAALLIVFSGGVSYALSQGRTPDCNCFGQVSSEQISGRTLARNGVLIAAAAFSVWRGPGAPIDRWTTSLSGGDLVAGLAVILLALAAIAILHMRSQLVSLASLLERGTPAVMVFASQTCGPCAQMLPELVRWSETLEERLAFALIESDVRDVEALAEQISSHGAILTLLDDGHDVASAYDVAATPTAVLVGADGRIASWHASGAGNIEGLIRSALEGPAAIQGVVAA